MILHDSERHISLFNTGQKAFRSSDCIQAFQT